MPRANATTITVTAVRSCQRLLPAWMPDVLLTLCVIALLMLCVIVLLTLRVRGRAWSVNGSATRSVTNTAGGTLREASTAKPVTSTIQASRWERKPK